MVDNPNYKIEWEDIDLESAYNYIYKYLEKKYGVDEDGDSHVQFELINRRTHYGMHYQPSPYPHDNYDETRKAATPDEVLKIAMFNMSIAQKELELALYLMEADK